MNPFVVKAVKFLASIRVGIEGGNVRVTPANFDGLEAKVGVDGAVLKVGQREYKIGPDELRKLKAMGAKGVQTLSKKKVVRGPNAGRITRAVDRVRKCKAGGLRVILKPEPKVPWWQRLVR